MLTHIDKTVKEDSRSRSELIHEAVCLYIEKKQKWKNIFTYGEKQPIKQRLTEENVIDEIKKLSRIE